MTSLIIPSFNRSDKLKETLKNILNQTIKPDEIIVVDDGSKEEELSQKKSFISDFSLNIQLILQTNGGASVAMNTGAEKAKGNLLIFLDDDILASTRLIEQHIQHHQSLPGTILYGSAETDPLNIENDIQAYKLFMEKKWRLKTPEFNKKNQITFFNFMVTTANFSICKSDYSKIGGMDINLRDGYDVDFGIRSLIMGIPSYFDQNIKAIHNDKITLRYYAKRQKAYINSKRILLNKFPGQEDLLSKGAVYKISPLKKLVYKLLGSKIIVNIEETGILKYFLPKKIRFKLYGSTIAALSLND